jgi:hypothetical protein
MKLLDIILEDRPRNEKSDEDLKRDLLSSPNTTGLTFDNGNYTLTIDRNDPLSNVSGVNDTRDQAVIFDNNLSTGLSNLLPFSVSI